MGETLTPAVVLFTTYQDELAWIQGAVKDNFSGVDHLDVLEAGCGRAWYLDLDPLRLQITGVDLDEEALQHRAAAVGDLHHAVHGDLRTVDLPAKAFDLTYSAYVLEHVNDVEAVFANFVRWTRPGGLILLRMPDRETVFGLLARSTPYRTHIWFYRYVLRLKDAGREGRPPFPTVYEREMSRSSIVSFFTGHGCDVVGECITVPFVGHDTAFWRLVRIVMRCVGALTRGRLSGGHTNFSMVIRRRTDD